MKLLKTITSVMLAAGIIAGSAAVPVKENSVEAAGSKLMYNDVASKLQSRINEEKNKFPNGKYWNHKGRSTGDEDDYSYIACNHIQDKVNENLYCSTVKDSKGKVFHQCGGFAYKLAKDIWQTTEFYSNAIDSTYEPKVGDNVRFEVPVEDKTKTKKASNTQPHSIFITGISGDKITFAECNGDLEDCKICWGSEKYYTKVIAETKSVKKSDGTYADATLYSGVSSSRTYVTKSYLIKYGSSYQRPFIAGDLNMNGKLDNGDAEIFESTVMKDGKTTYSLNGTLYESRPLSYYDVTGDGYVDANDYNQIRYGSNNLRIVAADEQYTKSRWNTLNNDLGFSTCAGDYYVNNGDGTVAWIGCVDREIKNYYVPATVYSDGDKKLYDVTEIGYSSHKGQAGERTCTQDYKIQTLYIPDSVKSIHSYALMNWSVTSIRFYGSTPKLETIDSNAFEGCSALKTLDLSSAINLKTIKNAAFEGCTSLYHIDLPCSINDLTLGSDNGSIFGSTDPDGVTIEINTPPSACKYQNVIISSGDYNNWRKNDIYFYGRHFKLYKLNTKNYIGQVDKYHNYLRP